MLQAIRIKNYAILEEQEIRFSKGLNIITGETGAGKSILLGALDLILGARADSSVIVSGNQKCIIEAVFDGKMDGIREFLETQDLDLLPELLVRREITTNGKSRAFINDTPVLLNQLRDLSRLTTDMHQQFAVLEIQEQAYQYKALDAFASILDLTGNYRSRFKALKAREQDLSRLREQERQAAREKDYLEFQLKEFEAIDLNADEIDDLEQTFKRISHAQEIRSTLRQAYFELSESDRDMISKLREVHNDLEHLRAFDPAIASLSDRLGQVTLELDDIASEVLATGEKLEDEDISLEDLEHKLNMIRRLQLKHGAQDGKELFALKADMEEKLDTFASLDASIAAIEREINRERKELGVLAEAISKARKTHIPALENEVTQLLHELKMEHASIRIELAQAEVLNSHGRDNLQYLFAPNKGSDHQPIRKVASGGELSRLSLCFKAVVAKKMDMPVLVFDEIDQGVSGEVARRMGEILGELSDYHQVIMITHSPQIASRANTHLHVVKATRDNRTVAQITQLPEEARIVEIAKMLSGDPPTEAAVLNAKELINIS